MKRVTSTREERKEGSPKNRWFLLPFALAVGLSFLSLMGSRCDTWEEVWELRWINFLVIGPLWAVAAVLYFRGKVRIVLALLAFALPATGLSLLQSGVAQARFGMGPRSITIYAVRHTMERVLVYMKLHRQAPPNLKALPSEEGTFGKAVDGWGHDFQYSVDRDGVISLTSLGADGKPGGDGRNADIVLRYRTRNADGTLNVDDDDWMHNAKFE